MCEAVGVWSDGVNEKNSQVDWSVGDSKIVEIADLRANFILQLIRLLDLGRIWHI